MVLPRVSASLNFFYVKSNTEFFLSRDATTLLTDSTTFGQVSMSFTLPFRVGWRKEFIGPVLQISLI